MLRNIGSTWVMTVVTIAATYVLTPFIIRSLGRDGYGTWTLIATLTGYINLLALGVPMACVRYLAQHVAENDEQQVNRVIGSCAALYLMIGGAALAVGGALAAVFGMYDIPGGFQAQAWVAYAVMVIHVSAGFIGLLPEGIFFAHHDFIVRNAIRVAGVVLRLGLTLGVLTLDPSLVALASIQLACMAFEFTVSWILIRRRYPAVRLTLRYFNWAMVQTIFSFSLYVLLLQAGARLSFETSALVIGAFLGVDSIPFYVVANSLIVYLMEFVVAIASVVMPNATRLDTAGRRDELCDLFLKWSKVALSLSLLAGAFLIVLGPRFIAWWIDPSFEHPAGQVLQILMVSSLLFLPVRGVALPVLMGLGKPKVPAVAFLVAGLLNLALSVALAKPLGLAGVALGTAIPNALFAVVVLVLACRELDIGVLRYVQYVIPRAMLGALPGMALLLWFRLGVQVRDMVGLVAAGSAMVLVFGATWVLYVYRNDPYVNLRAHLARFRALGRA